MDQQRQAELAWSMPSPNDRLTRAFAQLEEQGLVARECLGLTVQDGWSYVGTGRGTQRGFHLSTQGIAAHGSR